MALSYAVIAWSCRLHRPIATAMALGFGALSIPLAFDADVTAASFALAGVLQLWVAVRYRSELYLAFGCLMQLGAGIAWLAIPSSTSGPFLDGEAIAGLWVGLVGITSAFILRRWQSGGRELGNLFGLWGMIWHVAIVGARLLQWMDDYSLMMWIWLAFCTVSSAAFYLLYRWRSMPFLLAAHPLLLIGIGAPFCFHVLAEVAPHDFIGPAVWPAALGVLTLWTRQIDRRLGEPNALANCLLHFTFLGMGLLILTIAVRVILGHGNRPDRLQGRMRLFHTITGLAVLTAATRLSADFVPAIRVSHFIYAALAWVTGMTSIETPFSSSRSAASSAW